MSENKRVIIPVPALVWEMEDFGAIGARHPFGKYLIATVGGQFSCAFGVYPTRAEAKNACQTDYERRLLEALTQNEN